MRLLLFFLLLVPVVSGYAGFADPVALSVVDGVVSVVDDAIYRQGWYSLAGQDWVAFNFSNDQATDWLLDGQASFSLDIPASSSDENYVIIYSCSRGSVQNPASSAGWDCHGGRWQVVQFNTAVQQNSTIVAVTDSGHIEGNIPQNTLDGNLVVDESSWSIEGDGSWIAYELSDIAWLEYVRFLFPYTSSRNFDVQVSNDSVSWTTILADVHSQENTPDLFERFDFPHPVRAKYVRFLGHGSSVSGPEGWNAIVETDINGFSVDLQEPVCTPQSHAVTCGGLCGQHLNNCGVQVDCGSCGSADAVVMYFNDFEHKSLGSYRERDTDWTYCQINPGESIYQNTGDAQNPSKVYRFFFPKGTVSLNNENGFRCEKDFDEGRDELYLSYRIKFGNGFDAVKGGKLPRLEAKTPAGLGAGYCPTGTDEFTGGMMFKKSGGNPVPVFYIYHPEQWNESWYQDVYRNVYGADASPTSCDDFFTQEMRDFGIQGVYGVTMYWNRSLVPGRWYTITERIVANTPGKHDGIAEGFIDGDLVVRRTDFRFRDVEELKINRVNFVSFFGGSGDEWASTKDQYVYFDDLIAYYYLPGGDVPIGNVPWDLGLSLPTPPYPDERVLD